MFLSVGSGLYGVLVGKLCRSIPVWTLITNACALLSEWAQPWLLGLKICSRMSLWGPLVEQRQTVTRDDEETRINNTIRVMWLNTNSYSQWHQLYFRHWQSERKLRVSPSLYTSNHATYLTWRTFTPFWQDARGTCVSSTYLHCEATSVNIGSYTHRGKRVTCLRSCISYSLCPADESEIPGSDISYIVGHIRWFYIWPQQSCDSLSVTFLIRMSFNKSQISSDDVWQTDWKYTRGGNELQIEKSEMRHQVWKEILLK